jgi:hypothetical protein
MFTVSLPALLKRLNRELAHEGLRLGLAIRKPYFELDVVPWRVGSERGDEICEWVDDAETKFAWWGVTLNTWCAFLRETKS